MMLCLVRKKGLEPPRREALEPKSSASTNSATFAQDLLSFLTPAFYRKPHASARGLRLFSTPGPEESTCFANIIRPSPAIRPFVPVDHYENFPVASWLLPAALRRPIEVIYAFARTADDFADEGSRPAVERLELLGSYEKQLDALAAGVPSHDPLFQDLAAIIGQYHLPIGLFRDLLDAFKQDVVQTRYKDFDELLDYCRRSANPIGRLLLHLYGKTSPENLLCSDRICSALQLINHWQDVAVDWQKNETGRVYLPQEDLARFGLADADIASASCSSSWQQMMAFQCARARSMMLSGKPLGNVLTGRIGLELRAIIAGGLAILDKIDAVQGDVFRHRPQLTKWDWLRICPGVLLHA